jgi:tricorn protease-like protein
MFTIKTIDNESEQADRARYAAVLQTYGGVCENNNRYAVAMKLISGGDMSFESAGDIFAYAPEKMSLEAGLNVRVRASNKYETANSNSEIYEDEYSFCTDGIYYGDKMVSLPDGFIFLPNVGIFVEVDGNMLCIASFQYRQDDRGIYYNDKRVLNTAYTFESDGIYYNNRKILSV